MDLDPSGTVRILCVDDEPDVADLTGTVLEREHADFDVETATSASEGLDRLADGQFDCVVSDYEMPGTDGIEFLERIRETRPEIPFILFTGKGSEAVASEAISAGVTDYLQKTTGNNQYTVLANRISNAVEQYRSRRLLERSQQRLRELVDALPHLLYIVDEDGTYLLANRALAEFHGTTVEAIEGATVADVLDEPAAEQFRDHLETVLESAESLRVPEAEVIGHDGETHVFEPRLFPHGLKGTERRAVLGIAVDVTDRKAREREIEETNALLSTLFDTLPVGVLAEDESRNVLAVNQRLLNLFGIADPPSAVVGRDCRRFGQEMSELFADPERFRDGIDEWIEKGEPATEPEFDLVDGRTVEREYRPIELPEGTGHLWVYRDVTERTRRERELSSVVDRLEALHEATRDLIRTDDRESVARIVADAVRSILDHPSNVVRFREGDILRPVAVTSEARRDLGDRPSYAIDEGFPGEVYSRGEPRLIEDFEECERDVDRGPHRSALYLPIGDHGTLSIGDDAPGTFGPLDRTLATVLANNAATVLDRLAGERALERQNERFTEFGRVVSHDLRNPLEVAQTRCRLAREDRDFDHLDAVERAHDRMEALIDDLLVLARDGDEGSNREWIDFADLVDRCWTTVRTADATLDNGATGRIRADESRLRQLLENLLRNAVEHSSTSPDSQARQDAIQHGGETVRIRIESTERGFVVSDDGPGIPPAERERVFEVGYSTAEEGTGFGLGIVSQVADAHGWDVTVTDSERGGTRLEFTRVEIEQ